MQCNKAMLFVVMLGSAHAMRATVTVRGADDGAPKVCMPDDTPGNSVDQKCGHMAAFQTAFAQIGQPGFKEYPEHEGDQFDYSTRLSKDCEEPKNRPHSFNGAGPPVVYCCVTAEKKVSEFEKREAHCDEDGLPVPCWKTLVKAIPTYLMYYRSRVADLCKTTTTTTTTTTKHNTTTTTQKAESITENVGNVTHNDSLEENFLAFCLRKCEAMVVMDEKESCEDLCEVLNERHEEEMDELKKNMSSTEVDCSKCPKEESVANGTAEAKPAAEEAKSEGNKTDGGNKTV